MAGKKLGFFGEKKVVSLMVNVVTVAVSLGISVAQPADWLGPKDLWLSRLIGLVQRLLMLYSSNEACELSEFHSHNDSTINAAWSQILESS